MQQIYKNSEAKHYKLPENHPVVSLIYILLLIFTGALSFGLIAILIGMASYGLDIIKDLPVILKGNDPSKVDFIKLLQTLSSIGTFIVPAYFLMLIEKKRTSYFNFSVPRPTVSLLLAAIIMLVSAPFLELTILLNLKMQLPDFLSGLETWMKAKELEMENLTKLLLSTTSYGGLLFNLFMIAVIPAIGEELIFRGILQNIFTRWMKNPHVAIWFTAIIFSAIHVQFYGFLPRMLMGALFGYLLYWGNSIWLPIIAHFINNASAVLYAFFLIKQGKSVDEVTDVTTSPWFWYVLSILGTIGIIYYFWQITKQKNNLTTESDSLTQ